MKIGIDTYGYIWSGIALRSLNLPSLDTNLASPMARMRAYSVEVFLCAIDLASDLGIANLVVVPGRMNPLLPPSMARREGWMRESLDALIPYAELAALGFPACYSEAMA